MAPSMNTANDKYRQCVNGAHLPFGDDAGMRSMEKQLRSMPETFAISPETLLTLVNTPSLNSLELTIGVDRFDQLEDFQNRKVNADATKNVSDDAGDKFLKDQVRIYLLFFVSHPVLLSINQRRSLKWVWFGE